MCFPSQVIMLPIIKMVFLNMYICVWKLGFLKSIHISSFIESRKNVYILYGTEYRGMLWSWEFKPTNVIWRFCLYQCMELGHTYLILCCVGPTNPLFSSFNWLWKSCACINIRHGISIIFIWLTLTVRQEFLCHFSRKQLATRQPSDLKKLRSA